MLVSCGSNDKPLNQTEESSVEEQLAKDQVAMDSIERAIKSQLDSTENDLDTTEE